MKKIVGSVAVLSSLLVLMTAPVFAAPTSTISNRPGIFRGHHRFVKGINSVASTNWSGYAATGNNGSFNNVSSNWVQPVLNCAALPNQNSYSANWVGLDGYSSSTVEQIGTEADCYNNQPYYSVWYEMYPLNPYEIRTNLTVHPGDQITANVQYNAPTYAIVRGRLRQVTVANYVLKLTNSSTGKSFTTTQSSRINFSRSSAEVITEAPYSNGVLPLADYGIINYTNSTANNLPLGSAPGLQNIVMQNPAGMVSTPSLFDPTNKNFSITWSTT